MTLRFCLLIIACAFGVLMLGSSTFGSISGSTVTEIVHVEGSFHQYVSDAVLPKVQGAVGPQPSSEGHDSSGNPTSSFHSIWAKFGHQVSGSECQTPPMHTRTDPDPLMAEADQRYDYCSTWLNLRFTRSSADHLPYRVDHEEVEMKEKKTGMHARDSTSTCPGPPIWKTNPWVKVSKPRIQWLRPNSTPQDMAAGDSDTWTPPTPDYDPTMGNENQASGDSTSSSHQARLAAGSAPPGHWYTYSSTPNPPDYQDSSGGNTSSEHGDRTWRDYSTDPNKQDPNRSDSILVGVKVRTNLDAQPREIIVTSDYSTVKVIFKVKLKQTSSP